MHIEIPQGWSGEEERFKSIVSQMWNFRFSKGCVPFGPKDIGVSDGDAKIHANGYFLFLEFTTGEFMRTHQCMFYELLLRESRKISLLHIVCDGPSIFPIRTHIYTYPDRPYDLKLITRYRKELPKMITIHDEAALARLIGHHLARDILPSDYGNGHDQV